MAVLEQAILAQPFPSAAADAVETLVREHGRFVFQVAYSVLRHSHDAEDVAQETFLRVVKHRSELRAVREPKAWLARIAWRLAVDRKRSRPDTVTDPEELLAQLRATGASAEQLVARGEMKQLMETLIAALPKDLREPLQLSSVEEMSAAEIAVVVGIPEATVRTKLFRARQILKEKLAAMMEVKS